MIIESKHYFTKTLL